MDFFTNKVDVGELIPGDHIYAYRTANVYAHHGIYIGDHKVIGFTSRIISSSGFAFSSSLSSHKRCAALPECGTMKPNNGVVITCLDCFRHGRSVHRFNYGVSWLVRPTRIMPGTCSTKNSDPSEMVVHRAKGLLESGFGDYNLVNNNCEGFAYYCKTELLYIVRNTPNPKRHQIMTISRQIAAKKAATNSLALLAEQLVWKIVRVPVADLLLIHQSS